MQSSELRHKWGFDHGDGGSVIQVQALLSLRGLVGGDRSHVRTFGLEYRGQGEWPEGAR